MCIALNLSCIIYDDGTGTSTGNIEETPFIHLCSCANEDLEFLQFYNRYKHLSIKVLHFSDNINLKCYFQNYAITDVVGKISAEYGCKPIEGMLSHQLKQFRIDGEKSIIQNPSEAQRKEHEKATLETYEVYAMDVLVSTGEGVVSKKILCNYLASNSVSLNTR